MIFAASHFLGLSFTDRSIGCAEVSVQKDRPVVGKTVSFAFADHLSLEKPEVLGQALASFLRANGFSASRAVVGVPAKWIISLEKEIPPASEEQARAILRLEAERLNVADGGELVFDYAGQPQSDRPARVLLAAMLRLRLRQVEQAVKSAGLSIIAVVPSSLVLAGLVDQSGADSPLLLLARHGAEMVWSQQGRPRMLRHVLTPDGQAGAVATQAPELRRAVALAPASSGWVLYDELGLSDEQVSELSERLGVQIRRGAVQVAPGQCALPVALALAGADRKLLPMDFLHSRLAPPTKQGRLERPMAWAIAVAAAILIALIWLYLDVRARTSSLEQLQGRLKEMAGEIQAAQNAIDRYRFASGYFQSRPPMLECLREVTLAFRDDEQIWVSSFTLRDNGRGQLMGKANEWKTVLDVADRLRKNPAFSQVKVLDVSESGGRARPEASAFSISFNFDFGP